MYPGVFLNNLKEIERDFYVIQEFIFSADADKAPKEMLGRPASMRFLIDFLYSENNKIIPAFEAAYQRVSPFSEEYSEISKLSITERQRLFVQNKSRGAKSVPASDEEVLLARTTAEEIIHNLANGYRENLKQSREEGQNDVEQVVDV